MSNIIQTQSFCPVCWPWLFDAQADDVPVASPCKVHAEHPIARIWVCLTFNLGLTSDGHEIKGPNTTLPMRDTGAGESLTLEPGQKLVGAVNVAATRCVVEPIRRPGSISSQEDES